ncbi:MAG: metallophosphoesterase [Candidatus Heimdallarchaeota archaeon]|nr:MAG: metallophosphoesterase [Candidatus Heimdallarchaeota archaeon]
MSSTTQIIVFSDLHISRFSGYFHEEAFTNGIMSIAHQMRENPDTILINLGDITDQGTIEDYNYANALIKGTFATHGVEQPTIHYIPGNHDFRNIGMEIWQDLYGSRHFFIDTTKKGGKVVILGIDSVEPDANSGRIGSRGRDEIFARLSSYPDEIIKILTFHHHLLPIPYTGRERSMIRDAGDVLPILWQAGVDIVIVGHRHFPNSFSISNGERKMLLINNGTFSSHKTRGKAGHVYLSLEISADELRVAFHGIDRYSIFQEPTTYIHSLDKGLISSYSVAQPSQTLVAKVCQITCFHFTKKSEFQRDIFNKGIQMILEEKPSLIVSCGGLTNDSYEEDYNLAKNFLDMLKEKNQPIVLVPGTRDLQPFGRTLWMKQVGPLNPIYDDSKNNIHVFGVNTGPEPNGIIGRSNLKSLRNEFEKFKDKRIFITLMHHSCMPVPQTAFERTIKDAGDALEFFTHHKIPLILSGLGHSAGALQVEESVFVNAGTFSSRKIRSKKRNTYNVLSLYNNQVLVVEEVEIHSSKRHHLGSYRVPIPMFDDSNI